MAAKIRTARTIRPQMFRLVFIGEVCSLTEHNEIDKILLRSIANLTAIMKESFITKGVPEAWERENE